MRARAHHISIAAMLACCQFLYLSASSVGLSFSGLVGANLADNKALATLSYTMMTVATALTTLFASRFMSRYGRRHGFILGSLFGIGGGLLSMLAVRHSIFVLFCVGGSLLGVYQAFAQHYRYAAADNAPDKDKSKVVSYVLLGGVAAAFVGPLLARETQELFPAAMFAGSYLGLAVLALLSIPMLMMLKFDNDLVVVSASANTRPIREILRDRRIVMAMACCAIGYAIMIYVMTATPLAFVGCGYSAGGAASVIQWHLLAMFAPSLVTGKLVARQGSSRIAIIGIVLEVMGCVISMLGTSPEHFYASLVLNGVGWNLMYVGGTALLTESYRPEERAKVQGMNEFITFGAVALGSGFSGWIYQKSGWVWVNLSSIVILMVFFVVFVLTERVSKQDGWVKTGD